MDSFILNLPNSCLFFTVDKAVGEQLRPQILSDAGLHVLDYLHQSIPDSTPDILETDWDPAAQQRRSLPDRHGLLLDGPRGALRI